MEVELHARSIAEEEAGACQFAVEESRELELSGIAVLEAVQIFQERYISKDQY